MKIMSRREVSQKPCPRAAPLPAECCRRWQRPQPVAMGVTIRRTLQSPCKTGDQCNFHITDAERTAAFIRHSALAASGTRSSVLLPSKIVTDQLRCYSKTKAEIAQVANVKTVFVNANAGLQPDQKQPSAPHQGECRVACASMRALRSSHRVGPIRQRFARR